MNPETLMDAAKRAMARSYSPYSSFKVGAAVLTKTGKIFTGCNVENASFGLSMCAERVAIFKAISEGEAISALAVASQSGNSQPCGSCRQVMVEFNPNAEVYYQANGETISTIVSQLLPAPFTSAYIP